MTGTFRYAHIFPRAIALAAERRVDLEGLATRCFALAETEAALRYARHDPTPSRGLSS